jgi:hypothetical protein
MRGSLKVFSPELLKDPIGIKFPLRGSNQLALIIFTRNRSHVYFHRVTGGNINHNF